MNPSNPLNTTDTSRRKIPIELANPKDINFNWYNLRLYQKQSSLYVPILKTPDSILI